MADLATRFGVSGVTIRKDLVVLESERRLVRTHGGAIAIDRSRAELAFDVRERLQSDEKGWIGAAGPASSTTARASSWTRAPRRSSVARHLTARGGWSQLTVITNGLRLATELAGQPGITRADARRARPLGGPVGRRPAGRRPLRRINVQKAFVGAAGFTLDAGLTDATDEEAQIKRSMVAAAREVIAIVDHTKWERVAFATFCRTEQISVVVTDEGARGDGRGADRSRHPGAHRRADRPRRSERERRLRRREVHAVTVARHVATSRVDLRGISKRFAATQALDDVSLELLGRRGPRARRRERRRQEHAGQDPRRRPSAGQRDDLARRRGDADPRPGPRPRARDRRRPPGAAALPGPDGRRERVHRPRAGPVASGSIDWGGSRRAAEALFKELDVRFDVGRPSAACRWPTSS